MQVPLLMTVTKQDKLRIYSDKKYTDVDLPFKPYILQEAEFFKGLDSKTESWIKIPEYQETQYIKSNFNTIEDFNNFKKNNINLTSKMFYNGYIEQLLIDDPDFILKYPNKTKLKALFWDIEIQTIGDKRWPSAIERPILCIGWSTWYCNIDGSVEKIHKKIIHNFKEDEREDKLIIKEFVDDVQKEDPDIMVTYNGIDFDIPYIYQRSKIKNVPLNIGRDKREPWISAKGDITINGRINYDVILKVFRDQSLFGLKSKSLKEVARHYNVPLDKEHDIELELDNLWKLWKSDKNRVLQYIDSDVIRTEHVGPVYIRNDIVLAQMLQVPLGHITNMYPSFIPKITMGRNYKKYRLINTRTNFGKYNSLTGSIHKFRKFDNTELKFRAAINGIYKDGKFDCIYKLDYASQYPSSIQTWNLGPDTTSFVGIRELGKYAFTEDENYKWYEVPDENFGANIVIKVRKEEGFLKKDIASLREQRYIIKSKIKNAADNDKAILKSQDMAIKVILNSYYGIQSLNSSMYGDMIVGLMITALCRWSIIKVMHKVSDCLVEVDTDAIITSKRIPDNEINVWLAKEIEKTFNIKENYMVLESEDTGAAYFCAKKNYVVWDNGPIIHGSALKSSRLCPLIDRARNLAIDHWFNSKPIEEVIHEAYDFSNCEIKDFVYGVRLAKEISEYSNQEGQIPYLALQIEKKIGMACTKRTRIEYVISNKMIPDKELQKVRRAKSGENYLIVEYIDGIQDINMSYYREQIDKMLLLFGISNVIQEDLFADIFPKSNKKLDKIPYNI